MPGLNTITEEAQAYLDRLGAEAKELLPYAIDKKRGISVDDLLMEALEQDSPPVDMAVLYEAVRIRSKQLGIPEEKEAPQALLIRHPVQKQRKWSTLRIIAAAVACLVALYGVSMTAAYAFNWTFLLRIFSPVAGIFGISQRADDDVSLTLLHKSSMDDTDAAFAFIEQRYDDWEHIPKKIDKYPSVVRWVPEGYGFSYGQSFQNAYKSLLMTSYISGRGEILVYVLVAENPEEYGDILLEKDLTDIHEVTLLGKNVMLFTTNDDTLSAVLVDDGVYYHIWGPISESEILKMIESIYGG